MYFLARRFVLLVLQFFILSACSYNWGGVSRGIPGGYDKITVPMFRNSTAESGIEPYFTSAIIEEIERGALAHVTTRTDAQLILDGEIESVRFIQEEKATKDQGGAFANLPNDAVMTKAYRLVVAVKLSLRRISDETVIWSGDFQGEQRYEAPLVTDVNENSVNPLYNQSARHLTMKVLSKVIMAEVNDRMTENF